MFPTHEIGIGLCSLFLLSPAVYWARSRPTVQASAVALHHDERFHRFAGSVAIPTTLLSLFGIATLFDLPLTGAVPTDLLGRVLVVALPLTGIVLTAYLHVEFFAAVAAFQQLPSDLFGTLPGKGASRYQSWMYLVDAHHGGAPLAGPGAILALVATTGEAFLLMPLLAGVSLALTFHVLVLAFAMGADNGTLHRTHDEEVRSRIDAVVAQRDSGTLLAGGASSQ